ncbi:mRNA-binding protein nab2 [Malassezia sp. CBS 17886]|nr:mRNA-binding protein nab2 [Malassezia sp. CBS 17886]
MPASLSVDLGTPAGARVQDAVHHVLVAHEMAAGDDRVMAEYVTVMMANRKGPEAVAEELRELVGGELDARVPAEIWERAERAAGAEFGGEDGVPASPMDERAPPAAPAAPSSSARDRSQSPPPPQRGGGVRDAARWRDDARGEGEAASHRHACAPGARRARELFPDAGGARRLLRDARGGRAAPRGSAARTDGPPSQLSIFGRAGVPDPHAPPFVPGMAPPPEMMAAMAAMADAAAGPSLFARLDPMMPANPPVDPAAFAAATVAATRDPASFPSAPLETALCRWGTQCTNPLCPYSHPTSAGARKQGGDKALVLREDACADGAQCADTDCVKSHVSPAVAFINARVGSGTAAGAPGGAAAPCRFQTQCLNPGCTYTHYDPDGRVVPPRGSAAPGGAADAQRNAVPCRYGAHSGAKQDKLPVRRCVHTARLHLYASA